MTDFIKILTPDFIISAYNLCILLALDIINKLWYAYIFSLKISGSFLTVCVFLYLWPAIYLFFFLCIAVLLYSVACYLFIFCHFFFLCIAVLLYSWSTVWKLGLFHIGWAQVCNLLQTEMIVLLKASYSLMKSSLISRMPRGIKWIDQNKISIGLLHCIDSQGIKTRRFCCPNQLSIQI